MAERNLRRKESGVCSELCHLVAESTEAGLRAGPLLVKARSFLATRPDLRLQILNFQFSIGVRAPIPRFCAPVRSPTAD